MSKTAKVPLLTGAKIKSIRPVTASDCQSAGIDEPRGEMAIVLDTGVVLIALCDPEGNGIGHLVGQFKGDTFDVMPE